ncbi:MAG: ComEC/Rec2 family competence protein [Planctomycetes bacterium]|nr:ComEC/Rec2 family competence protein [Planctomycetota bacterium]
MAVGLVVGILVDDGVMVPPAVAAAIGAVAVLLGLVLPRGRRTVILNGVAATCLGALLYHNAYRRVPEDHVVHQVSTGPQVARLRGMIVSEPALRTRRTSPFERWFFDLERTSFILEAESADVGKGFVAVRGRVAVYIRETGLRWQLGDTVEVFGRLYRFSPPENPGGMDWQRHQRLRGIWVGMTAPVEECVLVDTADSRWSYRSAWQAVRHRVRALLLDDRIGTEYAESTLLEAMILGRRQAIDPRLNDAFRDAGCMHFLAVSGLHVGILALFIWWLAQLLGLSLRSSTALTMAATVVYALLVDPRPPIMRATIMTLAYGLSILMRRPRNFTQTMSLAATIILLIQPAALFDVGFQLSFTGIMGIAFVTPALIRIAGRAGASLIRLPSLPAPVKTTRSKSGRAVGWRIVAFLGRWLGLAIAVSLGAWVVSGPFMLAHFDQITPMGWLNSALAAPLVLVVLVVGFLAILTGLLWPTPAGYLSDAAGSLSSLLVRWLERLTEWTGGSVYVNQYLAAVPVWMVVFYFVVVGAAVYACLGRLKWRWVGALCSGLTALYFVWVYWPVQRAGVTMAVLAVGRGNAVVIEPPDGGAILYDAGTSKSYDIGALTVVPYLRSRGIRSVEAAIVSHPNLDHYSGLLSAVDRVRIERIVVGPFFERGGSTDEREPYDDESPLETLLSELTFRGRHLDVVRRGSPPLMFGDVGVEVLWPPDPPPFILGANDSSLVLRIRYGSRSILLCGDIEQRPQRWLMEHEDLRADVLLLPHHGSTRTTVPEFISAVDAAVVVNSSDTRRDRPGRSTVLDGVLAGRDYFNTADDGAVMVHVVDDEVRVTTMRPSATGRPDG